MKINLIILTINTYIIYKSGQLIYSANKVISLYKQDSPIVYFVPNRTVIKKRSYNPQNEMFRLLGTKRSFSQNETFFFSHPYPALFRLISHF